MDASPRGAARIVFLMDAGQILIPSSCHLSAVLPLLSRIRAKERLPFDSPLINFASRRKAVFPRSLVRARVNMAEECVCVANSFDRFRITRVDAPRRQ